MVVMECDHFSEVSRPGRQEDNNNDTVTDDDVDNEGETCQDETDIVNQDHIQEHFRHVTLPIHHLVSGGCGQTVAFNLSMVGSF